MQAIAIAGYRGENFRVVANQKIIAATNQQIGNTPGNLAREKRRRAVSSEEE